MNKIQKLIASIGTLVASLLLALPTYAQVNTSTVIDAVSAGVSDGTNAWGDMISGNIAGIMLVFGLAIGIFFVLKIFRKAAR